VEITLPALQSLTESVSLAYLSGLLGVGPSIYRDFAYEAPSTGSEELYPLFAGLPGVREWIGDRVVHQLSISTFAIPNKTFEETISIARNQVEDDKLGLLTPQARELGTDAAVLPDLLIAQLMKNGHTALTYDGQNFFDTAHPNYTSTGAPTTVANYVSGAGPSWYLIDTSRSVRSFIFQTRRPFKVVPKFSLTDPSVFFDNEFIWGIDGRCNAGYGLWHFAYRSDAALNLANLTAGRTMMASLRRPDGAPMGLAAGSSLKLVVPTALIGTALGYAGNEFDPNPVTAGTLVPNTMRGLITPLEDRWLN
jgi:phage major head subunit gpT-like protein